MRQYLPHSLALALIFIITLIYVPGLSGPYVLDDAGNITENTSVALKKISLSNIVAAVQSNDSGPSKRPLATLSFSLNYYFSDGFYPSFPFKVTNLAIHIVNTILVYCLFILLLRTSILDRLRIKNYDILIPGFIAAVWALHPIQLTNVLYVVQRMNSLAAFFVLSGLILFIYGRNRLEVSNSKGLLLMYTGVIAGTLLGILSKENAVLLPIFALVIEYTLYRREQLGINTRNNLWVFYAITVFLPATALIIYLLIHPEFITQIYVERHFGIFERLLTEARVLWFYISLIIFPSVYRLGLFHDDISISSGIFDPLSTLLAIIGIFVALLISILRTKRYPLFSFAVLWYIVGHSLESGIFGLEIAYEHRNYIPSIGPIFSLSYALLRFVTKANINVVYVWVLPLLTILILSTTTWSRASIWRNTYTLAEHNVKYHPNSPRANDFAARANLSEKNDIIKSINYTLKGIQLAPHEVGYHIDLRILLETISTNINATLHAKNKGNIIFSNIKMGGLPNAIKLAKNNYGIRLVSDSSANKLIKELLQYRAITVHGMFSLDTLRDCVLKTPYSCRSIQNEAMEWFTAAGMNINVPDKYRAQIFYNTALLYADMKNYHLGLDYINKALIIRPDIIFYRLKKAEYLISLGRLQDAKIQMDGVYAKLKNPYYPSTPENKETYNKLLTLYNKKLQ